MPDEYGLLYSKWDERQHLNAGLVGGKEKVREQSKERKEETYD